MYRAELVPGLRTCWLQMFQLYSIAVIPPLCHMTRALTFTLEPSCDIRCPSHLHMCPLYHLHACSSMTDWSALWCIFFCPLQSAALPTTTATDVLWQQLFCCNFEAASCKAAAGSAAVERALPALGATGTAAAAAAQQNLPLQQRLSQLADAVVQQCKPHYPLLLAGADGAAAASSSSCTARAPTAAAANKAAAAGVSGNIGNAQAISGRCQQI